ncbi:MAG: hypothetical protein JXA30_12425 [Deltaproteobacteria bacterium]|nr:hypothetical protein [Deltaproteobacteria bacterium]
MGYQYIVSYAGIQDRGYVDVELTKQPDLPYEKNDILTFLPKDARDNVAIVVKDKPVGQLEYAYSGMRVLDGNTNKYTSGFSVALCYHGVDGCLPAGVSTAGHCTNGIDHINCPIHGFHEFLVNTKVPGMRKE